MSRDSRQGCKKCKISQESDQSFPPSNKFPFSFEEDSHQFLGISLLTKGRNFPPNAKISQEWDSQIYPLFQACSHHKNGMRSCTHMDCNVCIRCHMIYTAIKLPILQTSNMPMRDSAIDWYQMNHHMIQADQLWMEI